MGASDLMRTVTYVCECGSTVGEVEGAFTGCLNCGKRPGSFSIRLGKPRRVFERCGIDATMVENERWSWSMGVNPEDIPTAMKAFPGSEYNHEGQLRVKSRHHKMTELKRRGLVECDGYRLRNQNKRKRTTNG